MKGERAVLHLVSSSAFAGTESYVATLAREQADRGRNVTVVGGDREFMRPFLGPNVIHRTYSGPLSTLGYLREAGPHFEVVHTHLTWAELIACLAYIKSTIHVVCTRHIAAKRGSSQLGGMAARVIRRRIDGQIAPSRYLAERIDGSSVVIPTGIPDRPLGPHDEPVVLVAQRLEREKDTATAIRAWAKSQLGSMGWRLEIAGKGSEESELRRLACALHVEKSCTFLGHVHDVPDRMNRASIILSTATSDSFGLTTLEAMSSGGAVVASAAGGHLETVGALEDAMLFQSGDYEAAANQLVWLATHSNARGEYGIRLQEFQRRELSVGSFVTRVENFYDLCLSREPRSLAKALRRR